MEEWKVLPINPNYSVSNLGNFRRETPGKATEVHQPVKSHKNKVTGYLCVTLSKSDKVNKPRTYSAHRLVAETWIDNPDKLPCVFHKNKNKTDNRVENLMWATYSQIAPYKFTRAENPQTGEVLEFQGMKRAAVHFGVSDTTIAHHVNTGKPFRGYLIYKVDKNSDKNN